MIHFSLENNLGVDDFIFFLERRGWWTAEYILYDFQTVWSMYFVTNYTLISNKI